MRIKKYMDEPLDLAYDNISIKYFKEPESGEAFGKMMLQELVFYSDHMLVHISDYAEEEEPVMACTTFWYDDITTYLFDCDENVLTFSFLERGDLKIYANETQLRKIYDIITTLDEKFVDTDFDETNKFFEEILANL